MSKWFLIACSAVVTLAGGFYLYQTQFLPSELRVAATNGDLARVKELIDKGVDVNQHLGSPSNSVLNRAIEGNNPAVVHTLLDAGADVNAVSESGMTPLMFSAFFGNASIVSLLIDAGARMDAVEPRHRNTALLIAVRKGHLETVKTLIRAKADPNQGAEWGSAPVCRAQALSHMDIDQVLRNAGGKCGTGGTAHIP